MKFRVIRTTTTVGHELLKRVQEYRRILEYVIDCIDFCPVCGQDKPGHKARCELAALLSEPM